MIYVIFFPFLYQNFVLEILQTICSFAIFSIETINNTIIKNIRYKIYTFNSINLK